MSNTEATLIRKAHRNLLILIIQEWRDDNPMLVAANDVQLARFVVETLDTPVPENVISRIIELAALIDLAVPERTP